MTDHRIDRPAEDGELCTCGRQAAFIVDAGVLGVVGWCGQMDGDREGPARSAAAAATRGNAPSTSCGPMPEREGLRGGWKPFPG
jgi:hypothetical protein